MSARCKKCSKVTQKPQMVTTKTRMHEHVEIRTNEEGYNVPMIVGMGPQIVAQEQRCNNCA